MAENERFESEGLRGELKLNWWALAGMFASVTAAVFATVSLWSLVTPNRAEYLSKSPPDQWYPASVSSVSMAATTADFAKLSGRFDKLDDRLVVIAGMGDDDKRDTELRVVRDQVSDLRKEVEALGTKLEVSRTPLDSKLDLHVAVEAARRDVERDWVRADLSDLKSLVVGLILIVVTVSVGLGAWTFNHFYQPLRRRRGKG